jgi:hypothetical protein
MAFFLPRSAIFCAREGPWRDSDTLKTRASIRLKRSRKDADDFVGEKDPLLLPCPLLLFFSSAGGTMMT